MRPVTKTVTGVGSSDWVKLDHKTAPFNVGLGCVVTGTATYTVQHTFDDVDSGGAVVAFDHATIVGQTANKDGNYAFPVRAIRLTITVGDGSVTMTSIQAGCGG